MVPFQVKGDKLVPTDDKDSSFVVDSSGGYVGGRFQLNEGAPVAEDGDTPFVVMVPFQVQGDNLVPVDSGTSNFIIGNDGEYSGGKLQLDGGEAPVKNQDPNFIIDSGTGYTGGNFQLNGRAAPAKNQDPNFVIGSDGQYTGGKLQLDGGTAPTTKGEDSPFVVMIPFQLQGDKLVPRLDGGNPNFVVGSDGKYTGGKLQLDGGAATATKGQDPSFVVMIPFQVQGDKLVPQLDGGNPSFIVGSDGKYTGGKLQLDSGTATATKGQDPNFVIDSDGKYTGGKLQLDGRAAGQDPNFVVDSGGYTGGKLELKGGSATARDGQDSSFVVMVPFQIQGDKLVPTGDSSFVLQGTFELNSGAVASRKPLVVESPDWKFQVNGGGPESNTFIVQSALVLMPGEGRSLVSRYQSLRNGRKSGNSQLEAFRRLIVHAGSSEPRNVEPVETVWLARALEINWKPSNDGSSSLVVLGPMILTPGNERSVLSRYESLTNSRRTLIIITDPPAHIDNAGNRDEKLASLPAQYQVRQWAQSGDCFTAIAAQSWAYGDARQWRVIYNANRDKLPDPNNPNLIRPGTVLDIPSLHGEPRSGIREETPIIAGGIRG
jgi:hypothetical protein